MNMQIRPMELKDAEAINNLRRMTGVMENILGVPSEPRRKTEQFLSEINPNHHHFVAVTTAEDGKEIVIGSAGIMVEAALRLRHAGYIGMMVHKDYQAQGVGSGLMAKLIDLADNWLMLVRLELGVIEDNERAIRLYEKFGFEKEGMKKMSIVRHGQYVNEYTMGRIHPAFHNFG